MTAGRGFAAYPLITEVLLLTGRGKLFPVKLGKQRGGKEAVEAGGAPRVADPVRQSENIRKHSGADRRAALSHGAVTSERTVEQPRGQVAAGFGRHDRHL